MIKIIIHTKSKLVSLLQNLGGVDLNRTESECGAFILSSASTLATHIDAKNPEDLIKDHTDGVFHASNRASNQNITEMFWGQNRTGQQAALVRSMLSIGPANDYTPSWYHRDNQGLLCQPSFKNHDKTPIEYLAHNHRIEANKAGGISTPRELMSNYIKLFTSTDDTHNECIDNLTIHFVKGMEQTVHIKGGRLDIVYTLRLAYIIGLVVFLSNPTQFNHYHPIHVITRIFIAQKKLFIVDHESRPLSEEEKRDYLISLGLSVYETFRKPIDATLFLNNRNLFSSALALGYVPPAPPEHKDHFFLFGETSTQGFKDEENMEARALDSNVVEFYINALNGENLGSYSREDLCNLIAMVCPKTSLKPNFATLRFFGFYDKKAKVAHISAHIHTFHAKHNIQAYIDAMP